MKCSKIKVNRCSKPKTKLIWTEKRFSKAFIFHFKLISNFNSGCSKKANAYCHISVKDSLSFIQTSYFQQSENLHAPIIANIITDYLFPNIRHNIRVRKTFSIRTSNRELYLSSQPIINDFLSIARGWTDNVLPGGSMYLSYQCLKVDW